MLPNDPNEGDDVLAMVLAMGRKGDPLSPPATLVMRPRKIKLMARYLFGILVELPECTPLAETCGGVLLLGCSALCASSSAVAGHRSFAASVLDFVAFLRYGDGSLHCD